MKKLFKGDPCRVRLHTGEVVEAVYSHESAVHYKSHYVNYNGQTLRTNNAMCWWRDSNFIALCRFVGPACVLVPVGVSV